MRSCRYSRRIIVAIAALTLASAAHAGSITIFNTGVNASGTPLLDGTVGDPHYTLFTVPGGTTDLLVRTWVGDNALSAWIGPNNNAQAFGPPGIYDYRTTFDLTGLVPGTATLLGRWSMDDLGVDILINGVSTGNTAPDPGFTGFFSFSINSGFVAGVNTLDFVVNNDDVEGANPTGLRVEVSGTAAATPEPASLVLFGAGFAGLCMFRRRLGWAGKL
jgi:PEP-CTERM motif